MEVILLVRCFISLLVGRNMVKKICYDLMHRINCHALEEFAE
jgi:hypothetical protein